MQLTLAAIGKLKDGPERELLERYWSRLEALGRRVALNPCTLVELPESRSTSAVARMTDESQRLLSKLGDTPLVILDERGKSLTSDAFAAFLRRRRDSGSNALAFVIGGPDGHGAPIRERASETLSFGAMTMPHGLARVLLAEQLYRAATIISGHPYHRV